MVLLRHAVMAREVRLNFDFWIIRFALPHFVVVNQSHLISYLFAHQCSDWISIMFSSMFVCMGLKFIPRVQTHQNGFYGIRTIEFRRVRGKWDPKREQTNSICAKWTDDANKNRTLSLCLVIKGGFRHPDISNPPIRYEIINETSTRAHEAV